MNTVSTNYHSLTNTMVSSYSTMSNMRLRQAVASKYGSVAAIPKATSALSSSASSFLKNYRQRMTDMSTAASQVLQSAVANKLRAASSDTGVAKVSGSMKNQSDVITLQVEQLASGQVNSSQSMTASGALPSMGGSLQIKTATGTKELYLSSAGAKTNKEALTNFAGKINAAGAGVTASVVEKDGQVSLELTGEIGKNFSLSGSLAQRMGLDQVAREKQDAVYTVQTNGGPEERFTAATNSVTLDGSITATLQKAGSITIKAGGNDTEAIADAMEELVRSFNSTLKLLNDNADRGIGVLRQMRRMVQPPTSEKSMERAGVTVNKDGTLSFDRDRFTSAMEKDPELIGGVAKSIARGVQQDAAAGMKEPSYSLVGNTASTKATQSTSYDMDTINFLSAYNRKGVYNTMNLYAVGALMNISV